MTLSPERSGGIFQWQTWLAALVVAVVAALVSWSDKAWRLDAWYYDLLLSNWVELPDDRVVIVGVDEQSLQALGQWPWPRSTHAQLVRRLSDAGVRGIAFDILFSEPGRDGDNGDEAFGNAIAQSRRTVLPVLPERTSDDGTLIESMQNPVIGARAARFGHTDVELDRDDIARSVYLHAGLGNAFWPALGLALVQVDTPQAGHATPGLRAPARRASSSYLWQRDHHVLLRYSGPPGSFAQLSYVDVLEGRVDPQLLRDRRVVVGVTAANLGRMFLTPMSGSVRMSGPEYQANVVQMLLRGNPILPLGPDWQLGLSGLLAGLTVLLAGATGNRWPWLTMLLAVVVPLAASLVLLRIANLWFAPMAAVTTVLVGHLLWTLVHLRHWRRQATMDPLTGLANRRGFDQALASEIASAQRMGVPLSLLLVDVDYFKSYNDHLGHNAGDKALARIGSLLKHSARRPRDVAARIGGDEFALILPETPPSGAKLIGQRLVSGMRDMTMPNAASPRGTLLTLSVGAYTCHPGTATSMKMVFDGADDALYTVKESGRDGFHSSASSDAATVDDDDTDMEPDAS